MNLYLKQILALILCFSFFSAILTASSSLDFNKKIISDDSKEGQESSEDDSKELKDEFASYNSDKISIIKYIIIASKSSDDCVCAKFSSQVLVPPPQNS